jgi:hypothetical protein
MLLPDSTGSVPEDVVVVSVVVKTVVVVVSDVVVDPGVLVVVVSVVDQDGVVGAVAGSTTRINPLTKSFSCSSSW